MPNWVFNNLSVTGDIDELVKFKEEMAKPYATYHHDIVRDENDEAVKNEDGSFKYAPVESVHESDLSFWNAIAPTDIDAYFGRKARKYEADRTNEQIWADIHREMLEDNDWYNWNVRNWGTKWDACNVAMWEEPNELRYDFDTAWSIPEPALIAMSEKYPTLTFDLHAEEEQGWGADILFKGGEANVMMEWDIPDSHADYVMLGRDCSACEYGINTDDMEYWYDDCPRPPLSEFDSDWKGPDLTDIPESGSMES